MGSVKESCAYIVTTKSRWVVSQFFNFVFMKVRVKNVLSSSTFPKTMTITSLTNLKGLDILSFKFWLLVIQLHMQMVGLQSHGGNMVELQLDCIVVIKNDDYCSSKITSNKGGWQTPFGSMIVAW
jgi:hypothetical protein